MNTKTPTRERIRQHLRVNGIVQGVGFRPHVYNLARSLDLTGFVGNDEKGVFIEVEGTPQSLDAFLHQLRTQSPPLAHIASLTARTIPPRDDIGFAIIASQNNGTGATLISPDVGLCDDCLRELNDPANRRYRYPFINCTNCGTRFTIIKTLPYDRPLTTMAHFKLCDACQMEYDDPADRRFHAQPNACPDCGPHLTWQSATAYTTHESALQHARQTLFDGGIIALKGIGGYHLACSAINPSAVATLRQRKQRLAKPFAVMVANIEQAHTVADITPQEAHLLTSQQRPIVLVNKHPDDFLAPNVAPDVVWQGLFLPYTPLHHLLLEDMPPLIMTSANISGEPIISDDEEVQTNLAHIADGFLMHNRPIHIHCDDSVLRVIGDDIVPLRRSRGYAPYPVALPDALPPSLAVGAEIKNTFCLTRGSEAFMSQHIGDMGSLATLHAFESAVDHLCHIFDVRPERIIADAHPAYMTTHFAQQLSERWRAPLVRVQHHHAHIVSVMADNQLSTDESVIGICWDGTGYGDDGAIWGGEVLIANDTHYERIAHLTYAPLLGGDTSVRYPYRTALAQLWAHGITWADDLFPVQRATQQERRIFEQQLTRQLNTIPTSSMGRLFDAVASLLGLCQDSHYEAHAPMLLEGIAQPAELAYTFELHTHRQPITIDPAPVLQGIIADMRHNIPTSIIAGRFHVSLVDIIQRLAHYLRNHTRLERIALSGGVFQNSILTQTTRQALIADGFEVLTHHQVPPNDGGLALGQAIIGAKSSNL